MGFSGTQPGQQRASRRVSRFLGVGLTLICVGPLASCAVPNSAMSGPLSENAAITEAHAAELGESPADIAQQVDQLTLEIAAATEAENDWGGFHYERAYYHHISGQLAAAIADYDIAVAAYGDRDSQLYSDRGLAHSAGGNGAAAIADFTKAIAIDQGWTDEAEALALTYVRRGEAHESLDHFDQALADYNTAIALEPHLSSAFSCRAYLHQRQDNLSLAIQDFTRHIQLSDNPTSWAYYGRGIAYETSGRSPQALADYSEAIALNDWGNGDRALDQQDQADAYFARAWLHHDLGNYRRAIHNYGESLKLNPIDALAFYNRGLAHEESNDLDRALADYTRAIQLNKNWGVIDIEGDYWGLASALQNRGRVYEHQGNIALAQADFQAATREKQGLK